MSKDEAWQGQMLRFSAADQGTVQPRWVHRALAGRRIAVLADRPYAGGTHEVQWDGTDLKGRPVPSGVYPVRLKASGDVATRAVTVVR